MKRTLIIILSAFLFACDKEPQQEHLIGTWECISSEDLETAKISYPKDTDDDFIVEFKSDSLFYGSDPASPDDSYAWKLFGDTLQFGEDKAGIVELTSTKFIVDVDVFGWSRLTFEKRE